MSSTPVRDHGARHGRWDPGLARSQPPRRELSGWGPPGDDGSGEPAGCGSASVAVGPLGDSIRVGTVALQVQNRSVIHRAPARFALTPTFQGRSRSLVTSSVKTVSSGDD